MGYVFELNGVPIKTTVVGPSDVRDHDYISSFFFSAHGPRTKVIGFDTEWILSDLYPPEGSHFHPKCATVHLCDGSSCLVVQLMGGSTTPFVTCSSLHNFLSLPNYTFVGVGIKDKLAKLEKIYGICCNTSMELGPLAASLLRKPGLSYSGVDELSLVVNNFDLRDHRPSTTSLDWAHYPLSKELAKLATINAYSYYAIGSKLLRKTNSVFVNF